MALLFIGRHIFHHSLSLSLALLCSGGESVRRHQIKTRNLAAAKFQKLCYFVLSGGKTNRAEWVLLTPRTVWEGSEKNHTFLSN
jgi:hypothetical protein